MEQKAGQRTCTDPPRFGTPPRAITEPHFFQTRLSPWLFSGAQRVMPGHSVGLERAGIWSEQKDDFLQEHAGKTCEAQNGMVLAKLEWKSCGIRRPRPADGCDRSSPPPSVLMPAAAAYINPTIFRKFVYGSCSPVF